MRFLRARIVKTSHSCMAYTSLRMKFASTVYDLFLQWEPPDPGRVSEGVSEEVSEGFSNCFRRVLS